MHAKKEDKVYRQIGQDADVVVLMDCFLIVYISDCENTLSKQYNFHVCKNISFTVIVVQGKKR